VVNEVHPALFLSPARVSRGKTSEELDRIPAPDRATEDEDWDLDRAPEPCKPKLRSVARPSRPETANKAETVMAEKREGKGKLARRLRSLVGDHRDLPV
jgi:hypothetical protein